MERTIIKHQSSTPFRESSSSESSLEEGLDEDCIGGKEGSCRRNGKCLASTEVRGSTSEGNSFELPEFQDMIK
ncbi:hypothetical protein V6N13_014217 [Hibiscus sabdariffa]|uniref:Uncharacterized protein n=1 Tax=Hibiscus sabdariffa TaxID=183260 RepID=A0ABR2RUR0_9ROSI